MIIHYEFDDEKHRRWKIAAATAGVTLKDFIEEALDEKAERVEREQPRKRRQR